MEEEISFGTWLRKQRRALDLSQKVLADQVGCAEVTLRRIEAGTLKPSKELASILLEKFSVPEAERSQWVSFARGLSGFPSQSISSLNKPITNLPAPLTTFIGREKEQSEVIQLLSKHRLVTLTGSGGVGKTRLSIKVGEQVLSNYLDGVWLVELAPILNPLLVPRTTAIAIGLRDEPQRPVIDMLCDYLREKRMLLILDNCEHLLGASAQLADTLLKRCPDLKILATSREASGILGEAVYRVPSLGLPDIQKLVEKFRDYESVRLFEERAQLARMDFSLTIDNAPSVAKICTHLDGIPLGIELAAARVGSFSTEQIADWLQESFSLLTTGNRTALPRHQTLQAAIDWSYDLLSPAEQTLFRRLSVFVNGWTLEAAESICSDANFKSEAISDLLAQLINKSLVIAEEERTTTRYHMLETIRQYAKENLIEAGEGETLCDRHLEYFSALVEAAQPHLIRSEQLEWLPLLDADYENLRIAFDYSLTKESAESSLRLCAALGWFWEIRCYELEGLDWLARALQKPMQDLSAGEKIARAKALYTCAMLEWQVGSTFQQVLSPAEESLALALEVCNRKDIAIARFFVGAALNQQGEDLDQARLLVEQSFMDFEDLPELFWQAYSFHLYGVTRSGLKYHDTLLRGLELARKAGDRLILANNLTTYANFLFSINEVVKARKTAEESESLYALLGSENSSINPLLFAEIAWSNGDHENAKSLYMKLLDRFTLIGQKGWRPNCVQRLGLLAMEEGDFTEARKWLEEALELEQQAVGWKPWIAYYLLELGNLSYLQGNIEQFKVSFREGLSLRDYFPKEHTTLILMTVLGSFYSQKPKISARLLGLIDACEKETDFPRNPIEKRYCIRAEAHARKILGDAVFQSAFAEGQKMSLDEALDLVLKTAEEM